MSYRSNYRSIFSGLGQTSKTATTSTSSTSKSGSSTQPDRTAQDWATALQTGGSLVSSIIGAATGQQQPQTPASTEPTTDPNAALAPAPVTPSWYWPVVIGVGGALLAGIVFVGYSAKKPVKANRRRMRRNSGLAFRVIGDGKVQVHAKSLSQAQGDASMFRRVGVRGVRVEQKVGSDWVSA